MWVNPKYKDHYQPPVPPTDDGRPLGVFPRGDGRDELRITLKTFEGRPYVALRAWERGSDGQSYPTKKGVTVRIHEIPDVIAALHQVEGLLEQESQGTRQEHPGRRHAAPTPPRPAAAGGRPCEPGIAPQQGQDDRPRYVERGRRPTPRALDPDDLPDPPRTDRDFDEL